MKKKPENDIHLTEKKILLYKHKMHCDNWMQEVSEGPRNLTIKSDMTLFMKCDLVCIIIAGGSLEGNVTEDA